MADEKKVGSTVKLNSGGPVMKISAVAGERALCDWWEGGCMMQDWFPLDAVSPCDPEPEPIEPQG